MTRTAYTPGVESRTRCTMPFAVSRPALEMISETSAMWIAGAIVFLLFCILTAHGLLTALTSLTTRIATRRKADTRTLSVKQLRATSDYAAATAEERAAVTMLHPTVKLVRENEFARHAATVAREIVGEEHCGEWPYRHINLDEAAEDLRESYTRIRI